jgi:hypothetical protein
MTQATADEATSARALSTLTERLVAHVERDIKKRLTQQAALEGCVPAVLVNRVLGGGLMTFDEIADATREQASAERGRGNGAH